MKSRIVRLNMEVGQEDGRETARLLRSAAIALLFAIQLTGCTVSRDYARPSCVETWRAKIATAAFPEHLSVQLVLARERRPADGFPQDGTTCAGSDHASAGGSYGARLE